MQDYFPFGLAPAIILVLTLLSGGWLALNPIDKQEDTTLRMWIFARGHYDAYQKALPAFHEKHPEEKVDLQNVGLEAVSTRLQAAFWADLEVPELVEVEISRAGTFFRGKAEDVGFQDLRPWLEETGLIDDIVQSRFTPYSKHGKIYGLPHDVHPVAIAYRRDIFERAGIDLSTVETWDEFVEIGRKMTVPGERYMLLASAGTYSDFEVLMFQRGTGYYDENGKLIMDNDIVRDLLLWFVPLCVGEDRIANNPGNFGAAFANAFGNGDVLCVLTPDWRSKLIEQDLERISGKVALMPMPAFEPGGRRTSTSGGTMLGITYSAEDPTAALNLARHLY